MLAAWLMRLLILPICYNNSVCTDRPLRTVSGEIIGEAVFWWVFQSKQRRLSGLKCRFNPVKLFSTFFWNRQKSCESCGTMRHLAGATPWRTLLTHAKVQEVLSLLGQGLTRNEAATIADVSIRSIYNIEHGLHRHRTPERCPVCGHKVLLPCRICARRKDRSAPLSPGADSFPLPRVNLNCLELRGKHRERYEEMRRKVEAEIAAGTRIENPWTSLLPLFLFSLQ